MRAMTPEECWRRQRKAFAKLKPSTLFSCHLENTDAPRPKIKPKYIAVRQLDGCIWEVIALNRENLQKIVGGFMPDKTALDFRDTDNLYIEELDF